MPVRIDKPYEEPRGEGGFSSLMRVAGLGAFVGGVGVALHKGFKENQTYFGKVAKEAETLMSQEKQRSIRPMFGAKHAFDEKLLEETFTAGRTVMSDLGWREFLKRTYERAAYKTGVLKDNEIQQLVEQLGDVGGSWENVRGHLVDKAGDLGGMERIYEEMRLMAGGSEAGRRGRSAADLIREFTTGTPGTRAGAPGIPMGPRPYLRSDFEPGGKFWTERFISSGGTAKSWGIRGLGLQAGVREQRLRDIFGNKIWGGARDPERPRFFRPGEASTWTFKFPEIGEQKLEFAEYQIGRGSNKFIQAPIAKTFAVEGGNLSLVATDHRGKGFAAVPHFAVPTEGGGRKVVSFNEGVSLMLFGDEKRKIDGIAMTLHKLGAESKAGRDLLASWNTTIRGLFFRVTGSQSDMTQALMQSESAVPIEQILSIIRDPKTQGSMEGLVKFYGEMKEAGKAGGFTVGPLASANPMAKHYRVSLRDWAKEMDVFGADYPMERRYMSRFREYSFTEEALKAAEAEPLMGIKGLSRLNPVTATETYAKVAHKSPMAVSYFALSELTPEELATGAIDFDREVAKELSKEEAVVSKRLASMMTVSEEQVYEVLAGSTMAQIGEELSPGQSLGMEYKTGKEILAKAHGEAVKQRIVGAETVGSITHLRVETILPQQDVTKLFAPKVVTRVANEGMAQHMMEQWGAKFSDPIKKYAHHVELIAHAEALKKIPAEVQKQMAEALYLTTAQKLQDVGAKTRIRGKRRIYTAKGGGPGGKRRGMPVKRMWQYVHDDTSRRKLLEKTVAAGAKTAEQLGLKGEAAHLGVGLEILRKAVIHGLSPDDIGMIGGLHYRLLLKEVKSEAKAAQILGEVGLGSAEIQALKASKGVLGLTSLHPGGFGSYDHKRRMATMDARALWEVKAQQWGTPGEELITEIVRRTIPQQDLGEMERAIRSFAGAAADLPENLKEITDAEEAISTLGKEGFLFKGKGKSFYVPSDQARRMGTYAYEVGAIGQQDLSKAYERYFNANKKLQQFETELSGTDFENLPEHKKLIDGIGEAEQSLRVEIDKQWKSAQSLKGRVIGTADPVAMRWMKGPKETPKMYQSIEEVIADQKNLFVVGVSDETYNRMFNDLMNVADENEKRFLESQRKAFMAGGDATGFIWRHPTHRPQSLMPAKFRRVDSKVEGAYFQKMTMKMGDRTLDLSLAAGMKLDYDMDHLSMGLVADEKVSTELEGLMKSEQWRRQFVDGVNRQASIMEAMGAAKGRGVKDVERHIQGLQRLVGVKLETGMISNLVGEMRAAAAFNADKDSFRLASFLFAELEEGPISSKKALYSAEVKDLLEEFVRPSGGGRNRVSDSLKEAWDILLDKGVIEAKDVRYSRDEFVDQMTQWISSSEARGELSAYRKMVRGVSKAAKGAAVEGITDDQILRAINLTESGKGNILANVAREMRMGPGSGLSASRRAMGLAADVGGMALQAFKKHWKYPLVGAGIALGLGAMAGGQDVSMPRNDPSIDATELATAQGSMANIRLPGVTQNRIITSGPNMGSGYRMSYSGDFSSRGMNELGAFGVESGSRVSVRDDRGAISPEYIRKSQDERYI